MSNKPTILSSTALLSTRTDQLPPHITFDEYQRLRRGIRDNWLKREKRTPRSDFYERRDLLFVDLLWATGARVDDLCRLTVKGVDFDKVMTEHLGRR